MWAPTGLGVYVSNREDQTKARKAMMEKFSVRKNGELPVWPGGSRMGFVPMKNGFIKSARTRSIVKKRFQYHIWMKTREQTIKTEFQNIHSITPALKGKTFHEIILDMEEDDKPGIKIFRHFNKEWSSDPNVSVWSLSVHENYVNAAVKKMMKIEEVIRDKYGEETVNNFFKPSANYSGNNSSLKFNLDEEDDDDWFLEDEEIKNLQEKGILIEGFEEAFKETTNENEEAT